jgi:hypothetical protein
VPNAKCLFSGLAFEIYKERISVPIHDFRSPFLGGVDDTHSLSHRISEAKILNDKLYKDLFQGLSTALHYAVRDFDGGHAT